MNTFYRFIPWLVLALATAYLVSAFPVKQSSSGFALEKFKSIPVSAEGRTKPLDTVARNNLLLMSGKRTLKIGEQRVDAIHWLIELMAGNPEAGEREVFRVDHPDLQSLLGRNPDDGKMFSYAQLAPYFRELDIQASRAAATEAGARTPYARAVLQLRGDVGRFQEIAQGTFPYAVAPMGVDPDWSPLANHHVGGATPPPNPSAAALIAMLHAYSANDSAAFNREVVNYLDLVKQAMPDATRRASIEVIFNGSTPFIHGIALYVAAFLLTCVAVLLDSGNRSELAHELGRAAIWLMFVAFAVHTLGLVARIYLQGRPPVTNLYSSAIFMGWGTVLAGLVIERFVPLRVAAIASSAVGIMSLIIAHNLAGGSDTMEMMQAVLDSNFWLATHVITVTMGYSATFLAGFLGATYILMGIFTRRLESDRRKMFSRMVYGVVCFALLLSFVGTVLGGIWADQSWGRFWGWDPKENGALLIVLMNAIILHARWGGLIRERGMMVLAVLGNIITAWSWFGTNMLGVGLHSYGFMDSAATWLMIFVLSQVAFMALGGVPLKYWRSMQKAAV
jgi:ABC-type transport system involved in cytochrome c biogenesis permease subunit